MDGHHPHRASVEGSMKVLRAVSSAFVLVILLFAVPWVIVEWGAWDEVSTLIGDPSLLLLPDDGHFVLAVLTLLGALFWVILACGILVELVDAARNRGPGRHEIPRRGGPVQWARTLVRPLVAAIFALSILGSSLHSAVAAEPTVQAPIASWATPEAESEAVILPVPQVISPLPQAPLGIQTEANGSTVYVVEPGDSLWSIAEKMYGDGRLWTKIAEENEDVVQGTANVIRVGWRLTIPPKDAAPEPEVVVVTPGESLWSIAEEYLGDGEQWPKIAQANQPQIVDPDLIQPGWQLVIPPEGLDPGSQAETTIDNQEGPPQEEPPQDSPPEEPPQEDGVDEPQPTPTTEVTDASPNVPSAEPQSMPPPASAEPLSVPTSASADPTPIGAVPSVPDEAPAEPEAEVENATLQKVAGFTAVLAGGVVLLLSRRRLAQLRARPLGRRIMQPGDEGHELETALGVVSSRSALDRIGSPGPDSTAGIVGVSQDGTGMWWMPDTGVQVCVGEDDEAEPVFADVSGAKPFLVCGEEDALGSAMRGIAMNMATEESQTDLHIVGDADLFDTFIAVELHPTYPDALDDLQRTVTTRRTFLGGRDWEALRIDPNFGEAWRPAVYIFLDPIDETQFFEVAEALQGPDIGVAVVVSMVGRPHKHNDVRISGRLLIGSKHSILDPGQIPIHPCSLEPSTGLADLLQTSISDDTTPAWWSASVPEHQSFVLPSIERGTDMSTVNHPTLKLLGPIELEDTQGVAPNRAERACMEYCAWILEHPGTTASAMSQGLMVAEGTRRSNMSRLRGWLGQDKDGNSYLPEAYSGRIWLHAAVTSDWHRMRQLISGGVEEVDTPNLLEALELVRGAPLADASPGQWHWAEEIRTDMVSVIRDIGVVAANRCLKQGDIDRARWAANRALVAAPEDELLLGAKVLIEHTAGNKMEAERLISWITRNARNVGIDLLPQTVAILKEVMSTTTGKE